jgi:hypothetical protein
MHFGLGGKGTWHLTLLGLVIITPEGIVTAESPLSDIHTLVVPLILRKYPREPWIRNSREIKNLKFMYYPFISFSVYLPHSNNPGNTDISTVSTSKTTIQFSISSETVIAYISHSARQPSSSSTAMIFHIHT